MAEPMSDERLEEIRQLRAAIAPSPPWHARAGMSIYNDVDHEIVVERGGEPTAITFMAASPEIVDELLAEVQRLRSLTAEQFLREKIAKSHQLRPEEQAKRLHRLDTWELEHRTRQP